MELGKHVFNKVQLHYKKILIALVILLVINLILGPKFKFIVLFIIFTLIGAFSTFYKNYLEGPINFELVKLGAIMMTVAYNPIAGISVGIIASVMGKILTGKVDQTIIMSIVGISVICVIAGFFQTPDIVLLGIVLTIVYYVVISPFIIMMGGSVWYGVIYIATDVIFNIFIFMRFAPFIYEAIT
ncbi:MAG: hypothetical protein GY861_19585 [bacterium]|nr:hypothetical protein [bacterium]